MTDYVNQLLGLLDKLQGLPGESLIFLGCIVIGYGLRFWGWFPNKMIPIAVIVSGSFLNTVIADPKTATMPFRVWLVRNVLIGLVIGFGAWISHYFIISRLEKRLVSLFGQPEQQTEDKKENTNEKVN